MGTQIVITGPVIEIPPRVELTVEAIQNPPLGGIASATDGANVGAGASVFKDKSGVSLNLRTLTAGAGVTLSETADEIEIASAGAGSPWEENANVISPVTVSDQVTIGTAAVVGAELLRVVGNTRLEGETASSLLAIGDATFVGAEKLRVVGGTRLEGAITGVLPDNTAAVLDIAEGANNILSVSTIDGSEEMAIGTSGVAMDFLFPSTGEFQIGSAGGQNSIQLADRANAPTPAADTGKVYSEKVNAISELHFVGDGASAAVQITVDGGVAPNLDVAIPDNDGTAYDIREGTRSYFRISTLDGGNQSMHFGDGAGLGGCSYAFDMKPNSTAFLCRRAAPSAQQEFVIDTSFNQLRFGNPTTNSTFRFLGDGPLILGSGGFADTASLQFNANPGNPPSATNAGKLFGRDLGSGVELFYIDNSAAIAQMTLDGFVNSTMATFTVATLPALTPSPRWIFVSNETGGPTPAFTDGTNWRRCTDLAIVS